MHFINVQQYFNEKKNATAHCEKSDLQCQIIIWSCISQIKKEKKSWQEHRKSILALS